MQILGINNEHNGTFMDYISEKEESFEGINTAINMPKCPRTVMQISGS